MSEYINTTAILGFELSSNIVFGLLIARIVNLPKRKMFVWKSAFCYLIDNQNRRE